MIHYFFLICEYPSGVLEQQMNISQAITDINHLELEGEWVLFRFELLAYYHRHILECLAFSDLFFCKKKALPWSNHILKIHLEIAFLKQNFQEKTLHKPFKIVIIQDLIEKNWFWNQFGTSGSAQTRKYMKVKVQVFQFGHFLRSKIDSRSSFLTKSYIITILSKKNCVAFRLKKNSVSKFDLTGVGLIFLGNKSEKAKLPKICLSFGGSMPEAQTKRCPLTPSPTRAKQ